MKARYINDKNRRENEAVLPHFPNLRNRKTKRWLEGIGEGYDTWQTMGQQTKNMG